MNTNDGGAAFPLMPPLDPGTGSSASGYPYPEHGMSLRDYFAAKAMAGMLASELVMRYSDDVLKATPSVTRAEWLAQQSYGFADAMLAARIGATHEQ